MIRITPAINIDDSEIEERFILAGGPGGQNVNKVATAVQLRFNAARSPALNSFIRARLAALAGRRMTKDGVLVITARRHRTQEHNRKDALQRLVAMIAEAATPATRRRPTRPSTGARKRRLEAKGRRAVVKRGRAKVGNFEG